MPLEPRVQRRAHETSQRARWFVYECVKAPYVDEQAISHGTPGDSSASPYQGCARSRQEQAGTGRSLTT